MPTRVWGVSYHRDGDSLVLYDQAWWVPLVDAICVPLIRYRATYRLGSWILNWDERGMTERHRMPLPDELADAWWRM